MATIPRNHTEIAALYQQHVTDERARRPELKGLEPVAVIAQKALADLIARAKDPLAAKVLGDQIKTIARSVVKNGLTDKEAGSALRREVIIETLRVHNCNQCHTADALRMHRNTLSRAIVEMRIPLDKLRAERKKARR